LQDTFDLAELNLHNGIEHDGSLTSESRNSISFKKQCAYIKSAGQDVKYDPDQGKPYLPFIHELLASATGKDKDGNQILTPADLSRYSGKRRAGARATNPDFTLDKFHKMFGSAK
jgi:hypothetical protein